MMRESADIRGTFIARGQTNAVIRVRIVVLDFTVAIRSELERCVHVEGRDIVLANL